MIIEAEIINQPFSGEYVEKIYDISSPWNSQEWTWVKFKCNDLSEWCGEFRGVPKEISISEKLDLILILTSDYLFQLDSRSGKLIDYEGQPQYQSLSVTPSGDFIIADQYNIKRICSSIKEKITIESPIQMDMIKFIGWEKNKLLIACDEFMNWDNHVVLVLDSITFDITIKKN